ncbi:MAG: hypothetical protein JEZ14_11635 [Marinilabiliaceae bacterium]|nr:hypothetical protein [Marinilabiliaceae bacterium]
MDEKTDYHHAKRLVKVLGIVTKNMERVTLVAALKVYRGDQPETQPATTEELEAAKAETEQIKEEYEELQGELDETKSELDETKEQLEETQSDLEKTQDQLEQTEPALDKQKEMEDHLEGHVETGGEGAGDAANKFEDLAKLAISQDKLNKAGRFLDRANELRRRANSNDNTAGNIQINFLISTDYNIELDKKSELLPYYLQAGLPTQLPSAFMYLLFGLYAHELPSKFNSIPDDLPDNVVI